MTFYQFNDNLMYTSAATCTGVSNCSVSAVGVILRCDFGSPRRYI